VVRRKSIASRSELVKAGIDPPRISAILNASVPTSDHVCQVPDPETQPHLPRQIAPKRSRALPGPGLQRSIAVTQSCTRLLVWNSGSYRSAI